MIIAGSQCVLEKLSENVENSREYRNRIKRNVGNTGTRRRFTGIPLFEISGVTRSRPGPGEVSGPAHERPRDLLQREADGPGPPAELPGD